MADPGDVVTVDFLGATGPKRRPAVVVSSALYHQHRPDLVSRAGVRCLSKSGRNSSTTRR
jgi:mRNA-degrading endonuclease toxin of MazEF toxin-antitoxin module